MTVQIRFVTCNDVPSAAIRFAQGFWASHCEAVMPDGTLLGAHADGGVKIRPAGYDKAIMRRELIVNVPLTPRQDQVFYSYLTDRIGRPYDFFSIFGFALRADLHDSLHLICSALQTGALRACGYFPMPLAIPFHAIDPRDLLLILSSHFQIDHAREDQQS